MSHQLAQLNIAVMKEPPQSPTMADFVANLDRINALAESAPGFVWRFQTDEGDATALPDAASIALHEALGFVPIGTYRGVGYKHGAWRDVGWRQRPIQPLREPTLPIAFAHARAG